MKNIEQIQVWLEELRWKFIIKCIVGIFQFTPLLDANCREECRRQRRNGIQYIIIISIRWNCVFRTEDISRKWLRTYSNVNMFDRVRVASVYRTHVERHTAWELWKRMINLHNNAQAIERRSRYRILCTFKTQARSTKQMDAQRRLYTLQDGTTKTEDDWIGSAIYCKHIEYVEMSIFVSVFELRIGDGRIYF